jgi:intron-binding protein aquarius
MPPKKRSNGEAPPDHATPTANAPDGEHPFAQLAQKHWLKSKKPVKVKPNVLKNEIWDVLEQEDFAFKSLLVLENLQILERYCSCELQRLGMLTTLIATYGQIILRTRPTFMS